MSEGLTRQGERMNLTLAFGSLAHREFYLLAVLGDFCLPPHPLALYVYAIYDPC